MRSPRRAGALVTAAVLVTGGGGAIGWAASHQQHPPQAPLASAPGHGPVTAAPTPPQASGQPSTAAAADPSSPPVRITIPAIGVRAPVDPIGLDPDGTLAVPAPGPHYDDAAWYQDSPTPGDLGPAVIEGHVDSAADGPSVFFRLGALRPGDQVVVTLADGTDVTFGVTRTARFPKDAFPTDAVYGDTDTPDLRLITCGGAFDRASGHYTDNTVAFATLVPDPTSP